MRILGIETSCDETAAAIVQDGRQILSNVIASQIDLHSPFGGVVPEVAARSHIEQILPVVERALAEGGSDWGDIDAIAVTKGPGLLGSLLIGVLAAKTLATVKKKPLYGINHVQAHVYAAFAQPSPPQFPLLALIVSGGHTSLVLFESHQNYRLLGTTRDDAAGEAFDKVAKILGLPYPGGPALSQLAKQGDPNAYRFPSARIKPYNFSFSGLKTAVLRQAQQLAGGDFRLPSTAVAAALTQTQKADLAASFQLSAVSSLAATVKDAQRELKPTSTVVAGGVAANQSLREQLPQATFAPANLCTDNAVMIAALAYHQAELSQPDSPATLVADSALSL
jgi:N6-L-threonylcarbamoyladenine synthase